MTQRLCSYSASDKTAILAGKEYPAQRFCSLCGRTDLPIEMAHMLPKSIGGKKCREHGESPRVPLCKACHGAHDSYKWKPVPYDDEWDVEVCDLGLLESLGYRGALDDNPHYSLMFDDGTNPDTMPDYGEDDIRELAECFDLAAKSDYLIGVQLIKMDKKMSRADLTQVVIDTLNIKEGSAPAYITKRIAYGRLQGEGIETLGVTKGYLVSQLCAEGHTLSDVLHNIQTMPRAQFDVQYGLAKTPKVRVCRHCGEPL